jgi:hypothetical protein
MPRRLKLKLDEAIEEVRTRPTVPLWPHLGLILRMSRGSVYEAARRGDIDVIQIGHRYKAVSATLRRKLGIDAA